MRELFLYGSVQYCYFFVDNMVICYLETLLDTTPLVMVVGGYTNYKEVIDPRTNRCIKDPETRRCILKRGLINDVELLSLSKKKRHKNLDL